MNTICIVCDSHEVMIKTKHSVDEIAKFLDMNSESMLVKITDETTGGRIALNPGKVSIVRCLYEEEKEKITPITNNGFIDTLTNSIVGGSSVATLSIDGAEIAKGIVKTINNMNNQIGRSFSRYD